MAYSGPPNWDEFDNESIEAFWTGRGENNATLSETADGVLRVTFAEPVDDTMQTGSLDQDADDSFTPISSGTPWEFYVRFKLSPTPYSDTGLEVPTPNEHGYRYFNWSLWDDVIAYDLRVSWNYTLTPQGYDMHLHESAYTFNVYMENEYDSEDVTYGPSWMTDRGVNEVLEFADENHNGWFIIGYAIDASGVQTVTLQPDGGDALDLTPAGLTTYDLDIGGKSGWGWGYSLVAREYNQGPTYVGGSPGPIDIDWVRESYDFSSGVSSGVSATLDGEAVEIAEQVIERYGDYIVYIDSSGVLKIKDSSITDFSTDVPIAVSASHL